MNNMTSLSAILAAVETSTEEIKTLEAELAAERDNGHHLVAQYRAQSADALKTLGILDVPVKSASRAAMKRADERRWQQHSALDQERWEECGTDPERRARR